MDIFGIGRAALPRAAPRAAARRGAGFRVGDQAPEAEVAALATPVGIASLAGLLAMQEAGEWDATEAARDRAAREQGHAVLDDLALLQRQLLGGAPDMTLLRRLAERTEAPAATGTPGLRALLGEIRLRARVELARYGLI